MRQIHQAAGVIQVRMRQDRPAQFGGIFTDAAQQIRERHFRLELPSESFEFEPRRKRVAGNFLVVLAGAAGVDQQVARGMLYEDAAGGRAEGKVAERFRRFDPASRDPGDRGNHRHNACVRCRRREGRSPEVEHVQGGRHYRYERDKQQGNAF
jgi:hypothetical protein